MIINGEQKPTDEIVNQLFEECGMGASRLGKALNISPNTIKHWQNNYNTPQTENFEKFANYCGYDVVLVKRG